MVVVVVVVLVLAQVPVIVLCAGDLEPILGQDWCKNLPILLLKVVLWG